MTKSSYKSLSQSAPFPPLPNSHANKMPEQTSLLTTSTHFPYGLNPFYNLFAPSPAFLTVSPLPSRQLYSFTGNTFYTRLNPKHMPDS